MKIKPAHKERQRIRQIRLERILNLYSRGYTCAQIGQMLRPQISRQAVSRVMVEHRKASGDER